VRVVNIAVGLRSAIADVQPIASQQAGVIAVLVLIVSAGRYGGLSGPKFAT